MALHAPIGNRIAIRRERWERSSVTHALQTPEKEAVLERTSVLNMAAASANFAQIPSIAFITCKAIGHDIDFSFMRILARSF
jgi:hypothetical protein